MTYPGKGSNVARLKTGGRRRTLPGEKGHRYSYTQISMYLRCAKQYEFTYIDGLRAPPGIALVEGGCHHRGLEHNNRHKMRTGRDVKPKEQMDVFMAAFEKQKAGIGIWGDDNENTVARRGEKIIKVYHEVYAPDLQPKAVETRYELEMAGRPFVMIVDVETDEAVLDYKVVSRRKSQRDVTNDLQLSTYAIGTKKTSVGFVQLVKLKTGPIVNEILTKRKQAQKKHALKVIGDTIGSILKGAFGRCNPSEWCCNPMYCGFYYKCQGIARKQKGKGVDLRELKSRARGGR